MSAQILLVADESGTDRWVAAAADGLLLTYVPHLDTFVLNEGLTRDWLGDQEMTYSPISHTTAAQLVAAGQIGRIDRRRNTWLARRFEAQSRRLPASEVIMAPLPRSRRDERRDAVAAVTSGVDRWVAYRSYPKSQRQTAQQMASDIRRGRVKAFVDLTVESRVRTTDEECVVEVRKSA